MVSSTAASSLAAYAASITGAAMAKGTGAALARGLADAECVGRAEEAAVRCAVVPQALKARASITPSVRIVIATARKCRNCGGMNQSDPY